MKLRIKGNSIRLRLTQSEVQSLAAGVVIRERTSFSPTSFFQYALQVDAGATNTFAQFHDNTLTVTLPQALAREWANSDQVGIQANYPIDSHDTFSILIEKDFACINPRIPAEDADTFPNPAATK